MHCNSFYWLWFNHYESNSESYKNNNQIISLMDAYSKEYNHEFKLATKDIEQRLYGKWQTGEEGLGYSLKYWVTGGAFDDGRLYISKDNLCILELVSILDDHLLTTGKYKYDMDEYKNPVFAYYQETLEQMKHDDFLDEYSGIADVDPNTVGTIVVAMGLSPDTPDTFKDIVKIKFILIKDYTIAVRQSSFYQLKKADW